MREEITEIIEKAKRSLIAAQNYIRMENMTKRQVSH